MRQKRKGHNRKYVLIISCNHSMKQTSKLKQNKTKNTSKNIAEEMLICYQFHYCEALL